MSIQYGNIMYVNLAVAHAFLLLLVVATAFNAARWHQLGDVPPCGLKSTYSSSSEDHDSLVGGVKYWWVYFGVLQICTFPRAVMGRFLLATVARDTRVTYISLVARSSAARQLCILKYLVYSAARKLTNCELASDSLAYCGSAFRQLGISAARQLRSSSADLQHGSLAARQLWKLDGFLTWQLGFVTLYFGSLVAWHFGSLAALKIGSAADYWQFYR